ncbi:MAG: hypothetical protein K2G70_07540 [Turicibacter sp.]|nr:hypothetical protein [Turicibacter sp.]
MKKNIIKNIYLCLSIVLCILSIFCGFESNDIVILWLSIFVENFCLISSQNNEGEGVNILFMPRFYKMNKYMMAILFIVIGGSPIILQYSLGYEYRLHHLINNIFTLPITLTALIKYVDKLDKKFGIIKSVNIYNNKAIFYWLSLMVNCCFIFVASFMKTYKRNPAKLYISNIVITSDSLNTVYLFLVLSLFVICISYIVIYFGFIAKKSEYYFFKDLFPSAPLTGVVIFYIIWGLMAFYETENRLEGAYYAGVVFFAVLIFVLTILLWFKSNTNGGKKLICYNSILVIILLIYGLAVLYSEQIGFSNANQEKENILYAIIITVVCVIIFIILFLICFSQKIKDKYINDNKK